MNRTSRKWIFCARSALRGIRSSPVTSGISTITIGVTLILVGAFALLLQNMQDLLDEFGDELRVTAYLETGIASVAMETLEDRVREVPGVAVVQSISPETALERFRESVGSGSALLEGMTSNPLPASLEISLSPERRSADGYQSVVEAIAELPGVVDLSSGREWVEGYLRAVSLIRGIGFGLGFILALATLLIVTNTIRLGIYSRRDELEILSLVGATRSFVRTPFLLEGVLQGAAGGAIAIGLLFAMFRIVLPGFEFGLELMVGTAPRFFSPGETFWLIGGGAALGMFGSAAALGGGLRE